MTSENKPVVIVSFDHAADPSISDFVLNAMDSRGIKATLYVQTGLLSAKKWNSTPDHLRKLYDKGWDLGSHTVTHARLGFLNEKAIEHELRASHFELMSLGFVRGSRHFSYPESSHSPLSLEIAKRFYSTARLVTGKLGKHVPLEDERYLLDCLSMKAIDTSDKAINYVNLAVEQNLVAHVMFEMIFKENPPAQGYLYNRFIEIIDYIAKLRDANDIEIKTVFEQYGD